MSTTFASEAQFGTETDFQADSLFVPENQLGNKNENHHEPSNSENAHFIPNSKLKSSIRLASQKTHVHSKKEIDSIVDNFLGGCKSPFTSIPHTFWYCVVTMTTVGYGDYVPASIIGKMIGAMCALFGVIIIALPMPSIIRNFERLHLECAGFLKYSFLKVNKSSNTNELNILKLTLIDFSIFY